MSGALIVPKQRTHAVRSLLSHFARSRACDLHVGCMATLDILLGSANPMAAIGSDVIVFSGVAECLEALGCLDAAGCENAEVCEDAAVRPDDGVSLEAFVHHR